jgi:hypothetical protein
VIDASRGSDAFEVCYGFHLANRGSAVPDSVPGGTPRRSAAPSVPGRVRGAFQCRATDADCLTGWLPDVREINKDLSSERRVKRAP